MNKTKVIWFDVNLAKWEYDWLSELLEEVETELIVTNTFDNLPPLENCVVVSNHAVNYRAYLDALRENCKHYGVILLSDENLREPLEYLHDPNCVFVARNYFHPFYHGHPKVSLFGLGYKKGFNAHEVKNKDFQSREYDWCFAGSIHGKERQEALEALKSFSSNHRIHTCSGFDAEDGLGTKEYREMLSNSKYALCPAGQDSMDSFRIYEALEAGAIPVTLKHTEHMRVEPSYWHAVFFGQQELPFVMGNSWEEVVEKLNAGESLPTAEQCGEFWTHWKKKWQTEFKKLFAKLN